ncbi:MAG: TerC family protein [Rhabdochlamydiaceae bacterium]|nr:TerC family protein [Rhabdochlamydiaceae bacterium]
MTHPYLFWIGFHILIICMLVLDLRGFHRKSHIVRRREALLLTLFWVAIALLFNVFVYYAISPNAALEFFTGFLIEKSLSIDNLFVFLLVFSYFKIPPYLQHKVLFWGILGAIFFRITLILLGVQFIQEFHWATTLLGVVLLTTGVKFALQKEQQMRPEKNIIVRLVRKVLPLSEKEDTAQFFVKEKGRWKMTTLFLVHLTIESADVIFALDSIPAIFAITNDAFIVYTSNIFAILGLRSLYFVLSGYFNKLRFFKYGLAAILVFIGSKMLLMKFYDMSLFLCLGIVVAILAATTGLSLLYPLKKKN